MKALVTGAAGFIGFHLSQALLARGDTVVGIDNLNDYYDVSLKKARLALLQEQAGFRFEGIDLCEADKLNALFAAEQFDCVVNLAAQAGVRYSLENPKAYVDSNVVGFSHVLEACRHHKVGHLVYASTSSVYGLNQQQPFSEHHGANHQTSFYAATKKANEAMAHSYAHLYGLPCTGLRFFTVYGPWGRPDMAYFKFVKCILAGEPIDIYNFGDMQRDFTYIDDIIDGIILSMDTPAKANPDWDVLQADPASSSAPYRLYNIGRGAPVDLMEFVSIIEKSAGKKAIINKLPMQPGDVYSTYADTTALQKLGFSPKTDLETGIKAFVDWYLVYYAQ